MELQLPEFLLKCIICAVTLNFYMSTEVIGKKVKPVKNDCPKDESGLNCRTEPPPTVLLKIPTKATFKDWAKWEVDFPSCNSSKNPNLSPINIVTSKAIRIKDETALIVHSGSPLKGAFLYSAEYNSDGVYIPAVTLGVRKSIFRDAMYISGVGNSVYRYFRKALFLFTSSGVETQRSLHQINGHIFKLEVVLTFADIPRSGDTPDDTTQIHVMVNISASDTPYWNFASAASALRQKTDDVAIDTNEKVEQKQKTAEEQNAILIKVLENEKNATNGVGYEDLYMDLNNLYLIVAHASDIEELRKAEISENKQIESLTKEGEAIRDKRIQIQSRLEDLKAKISQEIFQGTMARGDQNDKTDEVSRLTKEELEPLEQKWRDAQERLRTANSMYWNTFNQLKDQEALLTKHKIGEKIPDAVFKNVGELKKKRHEVKGKLDEIKRQKKAVDRATKDLEEEKSHAVRDVEVDAPFQPSWLLPNTGGYYRYKGSSPLPPCTKRERVIVMENQITISQAQFDMLAKHTHKGRTMEDLKNNVTLENMDRSIPILRPLGTRKVYFNKKNLQFKNDDSLHMLSKLRREIKDKMKESKGNTNHFFHMSDFICSTALILYII